MQINNHLQSKKEIINNNIRTCDFEVKYDLNVTTEISVNFFFNNFLSPETIFFTNQSDHQQYKNQYRNIFYNNS